jgi:gamma-glutamyl phosphate reductase
LHQQLDDRLHALGLPDLRRDVFPAALKPGEHFLVHGESAVFHVCIHLFAALVHLLQAFNHDADLVENVGRIQRLAVLALLFLQQILHHDRKKVRGGSGGAGSELVVH